MKRATGRRSIVAQSRPSEDGEVNKRQATPNALDPTMTFRQNDQADQFSPMAYKAQMIGLLGAAHLRTTCPFNGIQTVFPLLTV